MRRLALVAVLALVVGPVAPARAKGPTEVTVVGPGVNVTLHWTDDSAQVSVSRLAEAAEVYRLYGSGRSGKAQDLTSAQLGPRFVLTWGAGAEVVVAVQHVYPFAEGGAWIEVPPNQARRGGAVPAAWMKARGPLTKLLVRLGAERPAGEPPAMSEATPPVSRPAEAESNPAGRGAYLLAVPALAALALAVFLAARHLSGGYALRQGRLRLPRHRRRRLDQSPAPRPAPPHLRDTA